MVNLREGGRQMVKLSDYLMFTTSVHSERVVSWRKGEHEGKTITDLMEEGIQQEQSSNAFQSFNEEEQEIILNLIKTIYMENLEVPMNVKRFGEITSEMQEIYARKNHDYGNSFSESIDKYGYVAALVRISDKWNRLNSLLFKGDEAQVKDESVLDTITDMASYLVMLRMEYENRRDA